MRKLIKLSALLVINMLSTDIDHDKQAREKRNLRKHQKSLGVAAVVAIVLGSTCICCTVSCGGLICIGDRQKK